MKLHHYFRPFDTTTKTTFKKVTVQGGGTLKIETEGKGTSLEGETFIVESGGVIEADKFTLIADTLTVEDSAEISASEKVAIYIWCEYRPSRHRTSK